MSRFVLLLLLATSCQESARQPDAGYADVAGVDAGVDADSGDASAPPGWPADVAIDPNCEVPGIYTQPWGFAGQDTPESAVGTIDYVHGGYLDILADGALHRFELLDVETLHEWFTEGEAVRFGQTYRSDGAPQESFIHGVRHLDVGNYSTMCDEAIPSCPEQQSLQVHDTGVEVSVGEGEWQRYCAENGACGIEVGGFLSRPVTASYGGASVVTPGEVEGRWVFTTVLSSGRLYRDPGADCAQRQSTKLRVGVVTDPP